VCRGSSSLACPPQVLSLVQLATAAHRIVALDERNRKDA
jgi:hypothetical protein